LLSEALVAGRLIPTPCPAIPELERRMKCRKPGCACHADASKRHGPDWELTYKNQAKTVNLRLSPEAGPIYKAALSNTAN
jgi:hypothetical protein